jgi:hypothetical protein
MRRSRDRAGIIVDAEGTRANRAVEIAITETMIDRIKRAASTFNPRDSQATVFMVRLGCSKHWWIAGSLRMFRCGTSQLATMAPSADQTLSSIKTATSTFVRAAKTSPALAAALIRATSSTTEPTSIHLELTTAADIIDPCSSRSYK